MNKNRILVCYKGLIDQLLYVLLKHFMHYK